MRDAAKVALALVAGIGIGAWGIPALRAQTGPHPAYVVTETKVTDPAGFTEYMRGEPATLAPYHGRALARALPDTREGARQGAAVIRRQGRRLAAHVFGEAGRVGDFGFCLLYTSPSPRD